MASPDFAPPLITPGAPGFAPGLLDSTIPVASAPTPGKGLALDAQGNIPLSLRTGYEFSYDQITANVNCTATTEGTAKTILASTATVFDGAPVIAEFFSPLAVVSLAATVFYIILVEGSSTLGYLGAQQLAAASAGNPFVGKVRFTPSIGVHTYVVKGFVSSGTGTVNAGTSGSGYYPAYLRITKV
ncbi:MAG: hypothetical protein ACYC9L_05470 [Sulfuricaulis sp.]